MRKDNNTNIRNEKQDNNCTKTNGNIRSKKSKRKYRGSKNRASSEGKDLRSESNDPGWYTTRPELVRDAASLLFNYTTGNTYQIASGYEYVVPGIMTMKLAPSFGYSENRNSALNIASDAIFANLRAGKSGNPPYDAPDLMLYLMTMSQIYSYINYCMRIYGVIATYSQQNKYFGRALTMALGGDYDDISANLANYRYAINLLIDKAAAFAVPATMPIFNRHAFLYQNVFTEGPSVREQLYAYVPDGFYEYNEVSGAGKMSYVRFKYEPKTYKELINFGNELLEKATASQDLNMMSADILHAYQGNVIKLMSLPVDYSVVPIYDQLVLEQMKNATCVGPVSGMDITQSSDVAYLVHKPWTTKQAGYAEYKASAGRRLVTTENPDPDAGTLMEVTRLSVSMYVSGPDEITIKAGSEIPVAVYYFHSPYGTTFGSMYSDSTYALTVSEDSGVPRNYLLQHFQHRDAFKFAPTEFVYYQNVGETLETGSLECMYCKVDNFTILGVEDLFRLHETAMFSLFHIDVLQKINTTV